MLQTVLTALSQLATKPQLVEGYIPPQVSVRTGGLVLLAGMLTTSVLWAVGGFIPAFALFDTEWELVTEMISIGSSIAITLVTYWILQRLSGHSLLSQYLYLSGLLLFIGVFFICVYLILVTLGLYGLGEFILGLGMIYVLYIAIVSQAHLFKLSIWKVFAVVVVVGVLSTVLMEQLPRF